MDMIGHAIYNNRLLIFALNNSGNVFMQLILPRFANQVLSTFHRKNDLDIDL